MLLRFFPLAVLLAACAPPDYPGDPLAAAGPAEPIPRILPIEPFLSQLGPQRDAEDPDPRLRARGENLRGRADGDARMSSPTDLDTRGADLRRRAEEVRAETAR